MISMCLESVWGASIYLSFIPSLQLYLHSCIFTAGPLFSMPHTSLSKNHVLVTPVSPTRCPHYSAHYHPHPTQHYPRPHQLQLHNCKPFLPHPYSCYHQPCTHQTHPCVGYYTGNNGLHSRLYHATNDTSYLWLVV